MKHIIFIPLATLCLASCTTVPVSTVATEGFPVSNVSTTSYKKGQVLAESFSPFIQHAPTNMYSIEGRWTTADATQYKETGTYYGAQKNRSWSIEVYDSANPREIKDITTASNTYETNLGIAINASLRIGPRFERKTLPWGEAVSFLAQYQNDNTNYVPNNGMLQYEVHGLTKDGKYIRARFGVTHPGLAEFGNDSQELRDYRDGDPADPNSAMRKDPHYILVEKASPSSFEPSLSEIDRFLGTLVITE